MSPYLSRDEHKIYYQLDFDGEFDPNRLFVLIHGLTMDLNMWNFLVPLLIENKYGILRYDIRGHGRSGVPSSGYGMTSRLQDLLHLLDHLKIKSCIPVGCSLGGEEVIAMLVDYPNRCKAGILVDGWITGFKPSPDSPLIALPYHKIAKDESVSKAVELFQKTSFFDYLRSSHKWKLVLQIHQEHQKTGGFWLDDRSIKEPFINYLERLNEINLPVLTIVGEKDNIDFLNISHLVKKNVTSVKQVIFPDVGHLAPLEAPNRLFDTILSWLHEIENLA
ncbi:MAG: alpha/beta fold hydrolase [Candidatus Hodarchaeales archaeon]|jgi:pimeloyl-ACP methyl ester carboxylesterase